MKNKKSYKSICLLALLIILPACGSGEHITSSSAPSKQIVFNSEQDKEIEKMMKMKIGNTAVSVVWEENESIRALQRLCQNKPLSIDLHMYGGFEQVGHIGSPLPSNDRQIITEAGDIVLYSSNQIALFYGSNSWSYTRLGKITSKTSNELEDLLSNGDITITFTME